MEIDPYKVYSVKHISTIIINVNISGVYLWASHARRGNYRDYQYLRYLSKTRRWTYLQCDAVTLI